MPLKFSGVFPAVNATGDEIAYLTLNEGKFYKIEKNQKGHLGYEDHQDTLLELKFQGSSYKLTPEKDWGSVSTDVTMKVNESKSQLQLTTSDKDLVVFYKV